VSRLLWKVANGLYPGYGQMTRFIEQYVRLSPERASAETRASLYQYLQYCRRYAPYWRDRWPSHAERFGPEDAEDVLALLPPLDKFAIHDYRDALRVRPEDRQRDDGFPPLGPQREVRTGGTTGIPILLYQDSHFQPRGRATVDFCYRQCGLTPGDPFFYVWGSNNELSDLSRSWRKRVSTALRGVWPMPAYGLTPERIREIIRVINEQRQVKSAMCFTSALDTLLSYAEREGIELRRLDRVLTGGGILHEGLREKAQRLLAREVFDTYGSRDFGMMACETPAHDGLSAASWFNYLEVLDETGARVTFRGRGEIHVTAFWNFSFALIRTATGDTAQWRSEPGRNRIPTPTIEELGGRKAEHLRGPRGVVIDPSAVIHMIGVLLAPSWLRKFQLAQHGPSRFELRVESWEPALPSTALEQLRAEVQRGLSKLVGELVDVRINRLDVIPTAPSGKHLYCVDAADSVEL
jgi:phenylacetate-coenzyme A ligase PaaK-like adenylate-forming protein